MKLIIHGDDTVSSRKVLSEKKENFPEAEKITFDGNKSSLSDFVTAADSPSIFAGSKLIVVENFFTRAISREKEQIWDFLKLRNEYQVIFWEGKEIEKTVLNKYFSREEIISCVSPLLMFRFLDSLGSGQKTTTLSLFQSLLKQRDAAFVHTMLVRQIRLMIIAKDTGGRGLSDLSPWQAKKFQSQANYFTSDELHKAYRRLLALEYNLKAGLTPYNLNELLDIFLASL